MLISEFVRQQIRDLLIAPYLNNRCELAAYFADPAMEQALDSTIEHGENNSVLTMAPKRAREIVQQFQARLDRDESSVLVTSPGVRYFLRQITEVSHPNLTVLSQNEVPPEVTIVSLGVLKT